MANVNLNTAKGLLGVGKDAVVNTYISGAAVTAGDWVMLDVSETGEAIASTVIQAVDAVGTGIPLAVGVALETVAAAGLSIRVCVGGYVEEANVADAVNAAGRGLVVDNTANGRAVAIAATDIAPAVGVSLAAASSNVAPVYVFRRFV